MNTSNSGAGITVGAGESTGAVAGDGEGMFSGGRGGGGLRPQLSAVTRVRKQRTEKKSRASVLSELCGICL